MNILNTFQYHINNILNYHLKKYLKKKKLSLKTNIQCKINKNSTLILINKETLTLSPSNNNNSNNNKWKNPKIKKWNIMTYKSKENSNSHLTQHSTWYLYYQINSEKANQMKTNSKIYKTKTL